ncbi:MAG: acyl-CoA synthetase [Desulfobacterales bacterium]|nr:acyl-CoA synthetase [Desulfobacterales bacterium]
MDKFKITGLKYIREIEKTPFEERIKLLNTYDILKQGAAIDPEAVAISFFPTGGQYANPEQITYNELITNITRAANLFHDLGIGPKDVITYLLPSIPQAHYVVWGGEAAGIINPINPMLEPKTITEICQSAGTKILVALGETPGSDIWEKAMEVRKNLPDLKAVVRVMGPSDEKNGIYGFEEMLPRYNGDSLDSGRKIDPYDIASLYHTGGTTGTPKLAPHTHYHEAAMTYIMSATSELFKGDAILCGLPLFHVNGTMVTGAMPFSMGAHVVIMTAMGYRDPQVMMNFFKIIEHYRAVTFSGVPTILSVLMDIPLDGADISSLRYALCGAAPLSVDLVKRFEDKTGLKILEGYGLTEGTTGSSGNPYNGERKVGSIGIRIMYQDMRIFIVDDEGQFVREAETNEIGSLCIKGPNVFDGYLDEIHNKGIWPKGKEEGWLNTGDLGRQDEDEYFWLTGRSREVIIRGGHNIDPALIEDPIYGLPGIQVAAAIGKPDPHAGEVPVVYVQLQEGAEVTENEIMEFLKNEIGERAAIPKEVIIVDEIPLTPIGKIFKPLLKYDIIKRVYEKELENLNDIINTAEINVIEDRTHGISVSLKINPAQNISKEKIEEKIKEHLARYIIRYNLEIV